jgi:hypothetical protein
MREEKFVAAENSNDTHTHKNYLNVCVNNNKLNKNFPDAGL